MVVIPASERPHSLSPEQYGGPVHEAGDPLPISAWVHTPRDGHQRVEGVAVAWTPKAVKIRYMDPLGRQGVAWIRANAVDRR